MRSLCSWAAQCHMSEFKGSFPIPDRVLMKIVMLVYMHQLRSTSYSEEKRYLSGKS